MMKITWKRALSALLTVCMIASLLVVPAAAAEPTAADAGDASAGRYVLDAAGIGSETLTAMTTNASADTKVDVGTNNYFGVWQRSTKKAAADSAPSVEFPDGYVSGNNAVYFGGNINGKTQASIVFTVTSGKQAVVKVWAAGSGEAGDISFYDNGAFTKGSPAGKATVAAGVGSSCLCAFVTTSGGDCIIGTQAGKPYIYKIEVTEVEAAVAPSGVTVAGPDAATTSTVNIGTEQTLQLTATVAPSGASVSDVIWSSDNADVTVDKDGLVTVAAAAKDGSATITASSIVPGATAGTYIITLHSDHTHGSTWTLQEDGKVDATCTEDGSGVEKCEVAGCAGRDVVIPATGHDFNDEGVCQNDNTHKRKDLLLHTFNTTAGEWDSIVVPDAIKDAVVYDHGASSEVISSNDSGVGDSGHAVSFKGGTLQRHHKLSTDARTVTFTPQTSGTMYMFFYFAGTEKVKVTVDGTDSELTYEKDATANTAMVKMDVTADKTYTIVRADSTQTASLYALAFETTGKHAMVDGVCWLCGEEDSELPPAGNQHALTLTLDGVTAKVNGTDYTAAVDIDEDAAITVALTAAAGKALPETIAGLPTDWVYDKDAGTLTLAAGKWKADATIAVTATTVTPSVDKTALNTAITTAEGVTVNVEISEAGDGSDVDATDKWIAKSVKDTFDAALTAAKTVAAKADATQTEVTDAKTALESATTALQAAITNAANGTKPAGSPKPLVHIFEATNSTAAVTAIGNKATVTTGSTAGDFFTESGGDSPISGINTTTDVAYMLKGVALTGNPACAKLTKIGRYVSFKTPGEGTLKLYFLNGPKNAETPAVADVVSVNSTEKAVAVGYQVVDVTTAAGDNTYKVEAKDISADGNTEGLPFLYAAVWLPQGTTACAHDEAKWVKTTQTNEAGDGNVWAYCDNNALCFAMKAVAGNATEYTITVNSGSAKANGVAVTKAIEGAEVTVTANAAPSGKVFKEWNATGVTLDATQKAASEMTFEMPAADVTLTATYEDEGGVTPTVNKAALNDAITAAKAVVVGVEISEAGDGSDVLPANKWIAKSVKDAFDAALTDAETVAAKADATQTEVNDAKTALESAKTALETAITNAANGTKPADATDLANAIAAAEAKLVGITVADKTPSEMNKGTEFWTTEAKEALEAAIATAKAVDTDNDDLDAAIAALNDAVEAFQAAKQVGTKTSTGGSTSSRPSDRNPSASEPTTDPTKPETPVAADDVKVEKTETATKADGTKVTTTQLSNGSTAVTQVTLDGAVSVDVTDKDGEKIVAIDVPAEIPAAETKFEDVGDHWAAEAIDRMASLGLVNGVSEGTYNTEGEVTRATLATMLFRLANGAEGKTTAFADVKAGEWYADAIGWAAAAGVVTGYSETSFGPNDQLTREQMAVMLLRFAKLIGMDSSVDADVVASFGDVNSVNAWAADGMAWCVKNGIINGMGDNTLAPAGSATRAQTATMLDRFIGLLK